MATHTGSCHCGDVTFEVEGTIDAGMACNCSICRRKGALLWFVPREALRVTAGEAKLKDYTFNKHVIHHTFCPACGIHAFGHGTGPDGREMAAINLRCVDGVDLEALKVHHYDGAAL
ncbi:GFA family protein [Lysobacter sp. SG-8]|uniref:GFA family protein n=1 Tax=Marilutibacter penaei TaxID=2759900 RepID=A0A7W3YEP6_9GAMM|nr:GFA family protein [Lysobacter penaei]MBB1088638.1 GFA family protein [Lysobacter penaei]